MSLILAFETAEHICSVALFESGQLLAFEEDREANSHSAHLFTLVEKLMNQQGKELKELDAIAVNIGPGSYTGLRIACSAAKGVCYSLDIPVLGLTSMEILANAYVQTESCENRDVLACMLDARRMEVYVRYFDHQTKPLSEPEAVILETNMSLPISFDGDLHTIGSGALKASEIGYHQKAKYPKSIKLHAMHMGPLAEKAWRQKNFLDTAYFEPKYLKEFFFTPSKKG